MKIKLSDKFSYGKLVRFTLPSVIMMIFTSIYSIVDGIFVANFAGDTAFAAVNLIMPVLMILGCIGFMFGTGGSALISKTLGEKNPKKALRSYFLSWLTVTFTKISLFFLQGRNPSDGYLAPPTGFNF